MRAPRWLTPDGFGVLLELALRLGFGTGAALALALGQVLLALVLGGVALGLFLRVWRLRRRSRRPS